MAFDLVAQVLWCPENTYPYVCGMPLKCLADPHMFATELVYAWKETRPGFILKCASKVFSLRCSLLLKNLSLFLFAITAAGVVPCGGPKKSPLTSFIV